MFLLGDFFNIRVTINDYLKIYKKYTNFRYFIFYLSQRQNKLYCRIVYWSAGLLQLFGNIYIRMSRLQPKLSHLSVSQNHFVFLPIQH